MADQPRASELTANFLEVVQVKGGYRIDTRPLSLWSVLGAGQAQMAVRTNLIATQTFDDNVLERTSGAKTDEYVTSRSRGVVSRFPAGKASGSMVFTRPTTGAGAGDIPKDTQIRVPYNGKGYVFVVREDTAIASSALNVTVNVEAQQAGADANVGTVSSALALNGLPTALFDATLVPTTVTVAAGTEAEADADLKFRYRLWERGKRGGVEAAVAYGALSVNGVKHAVLAKMRDPHVGTLSAIYVGDVNWQSTQELRDAVTNELDNWISWGASADVRGMSQVDVPIAGVLRMVEPVAFYDINALRTAGAQAAVDYFERRKDPYAYDLAMIQGRLARVNDEVASVVLTSPASGVVSPLTPSQLKAAGRMPAVLTRYRTSRSLVNIDVEGPT